MTRSTKRVETWNRCSSSRLRGDTGVAIPITALFMVVLLGTAALIVDLGNGWRTRRSLIQATDSAALAAAQDFTDGQNGCLNGTAQAYVSFNEAAAVNFQCNRDPALRDHTGWVSVTTDHNVQTWFSSVIGLGDFPTTSTTTAWWGPHAAATGLRPIGLCINSDPALLAAINNTPPLPAVETPVQITYGSNQPNGCGGATPGNWGIIDFAFTNNGAPNIEDWIEFGYPGEVFFEDDGATSCSGEPHCYPGNPGAIANNLHDELTSLKTSGIYFEVPIFDHVEGNGSPLMYHIMATIRVRLIDFELQGPQAARFFELGIKPGLTSGTCCGNGNNTNGMIIGICGVDPNAFAACDP